VTCYQPLIYGSIATPLQSSADQYATHRWRLYVRSPSGAIGEAVRRVTFHLHPSFPDPVRVVEAPNMPGGSGFMVEEGGWGEFEAMIKIEWATQADAGPARKKQKGSAAVGDDERPLVVRHPIRLYHPGTTHAVCGVPPAACATSNFAPVEAPRAEDAEVPVVHE
jgi:hypothetical protein